LSKGSITDSMSKLKESVPRSQLKNGNVDVFGMQLTWEDSWHEMETAEWAMTKDSIICDECDEVIDSGELYSIGERQCCCDAPVPVYGIDRVHFYCTDDGKEVKRTAIDKGEDPFVALASFRDEIIKQHPNILATEQAFTGITAIITGEFPSSKEYYKGLIEKNGGFVRDNINAATTHMIVGEPGITPYGQKTGKGSKKYAEGKKKKLVIVDLNWINNGISEWGKSGLSVLNQAKSVEKEVTPIATITSPTSEESVNEKKRKIDDPIENCQLQSKKQKFDDSDLGKLKRKELQKLAKENGISANLKNEEIINQLLQK